MQLKATNSIRLIEKDSFVAFEVSTKNYRLWMEEGSTVFLIVYDAVARKAYWLYFQKYFEDDPVRKPQAAAKWITLRIPVTNELSEVTVDYMRERKAAFLTRFAKVRHHD